MNRTGQAILSVVWLGLLAWGTVGIYQRFFDGHALANYGSYVPWGLGVSAYIYFIGLSAGAFLLSSLIYVFGLEALEKVGRTALFIAILTLVMALVCILFDLGQMGRFYKIFTRPAFSSVMAWMVWLYSAYFLLILGELWIELRCDLSRLAEREGLLSSLYRCLSLGWRCPQDPEALAACHRQSRRWLRLLGGIGLPLAVAFHGGVGALFATLASRPYWHSALYPILFLTGALVSGGALLLATVAVSDIVGKNERGKVLKLLSRIVLGLLLLDLLWEWADFSIPLWYGVGAEPALLKEVLFGRFWYVFWLIHLLLGVLVPVVLFAWKPMSRWAAALGGGLVAATFLAVRLNIVIPGQVTPALKGLAEAYSDSRLLFEYTPSAFEWSVVAFVVAIGFALFYVGKSILPLTELQSSE